VGLRLEGLGASAGIHEGTARVVLDARELVDDFDPGDVLIAPATDPSWAPFFLVAGAVVIDTGSNISHAAVVAREMGIPAVVGVQAASMTIQSGQRLRVDGSAGTVEVID
jgi:phosphoenolpyruvate synthase/pyruvate phosphate dikinase